VLVSGRNLYGCDYLWTSAKHCSEPHWHFQWVKNDADTEKCEPCDAGHWMDGEPNDHIDKELYNVSENCMAKRSVGFNDDACFRKFAYVCQSTSGNRSTQVF